MTVQWPSRRLLLAWVAAATLGLLVGECECFAEVPRISRNTNICNAARAECAGYGGNGICQCSPRDGDGGWGCAPYNACGTTSAHTTCSGCKNYRNNWCGAVNYSCPNTYTRTSIMYQTPSTAVGSSHWPYRWCANWGCTTSDCCTINPLCSTYNCGSGYQSKSDASSIRCLSTSQTAYSCDRSRCCDQQVFCNSYGCPANWYRKSNAANIQCSGTTASSCTTVLCCSPECDAGTVACNSPLTWKSGYTTLQCGDSASCSATQCCNMMCIGYSCPANYYRPSSKNSVACSSSAASSCSAGLCCYPQCDAAGATGGCTGTDAPLANFASVNCAGATCTRAECCEATCASFTCDAAQYVARPTTTRCTGTLTCAASHCCAQLCTGCTSAQENKGAGWCSTSQCQNQECCRGHCSAYTGCTLGRQVTATAGANERVCAAADCTPQECCHGMCDTFIAGLVAGASTSNPTDTDGACGTGMVPTSKTTPCAGFYCTYDECCRQAGAGGWGDFSICSSNCGGGFMTRECNNPVPDVGGAPCAGLSERECMTQACVGEENPPLDTGNTYTLGSGAQRGNDEAATAAALFAVVVVLAVGTAGVVWRKTHTATGSDGDGVGSVRRSSLSDVVKGALRGALNVDAHSNVKEILRRQSLSMSERRKTIELDEQGRITNATAVSAVANADGDVVDHSGGGRGSSARRRSRSGSRKRRGSAGSRSRRAVRLLEAANGVVRETVPIRGRTDCGACSLTTLQVGRSAPAYCQHCGDEGLGGAKVMVNRNDSYRLEVTFKMCSSCRFHMTSLQDGGDLAFCASCGLRQPGQASHGPNKVFEV